MLSVPYVGERLARASPRGDHEVGSGNAERYGVALMAVQLVPLEDVAGVIVQQARCHDVGCEQDSC